MARFGKTPSDVQIRYAQYVRALQYIGPIYIKDKKVEKFSNGFFVEFSTKPTELSRTYRVLLIYIYGYQPYSYVLSPDLVEIADREDYVPHLYSQEKNRLCLTFPDFHEWTSQMLIMDTYMSWIIHWLFYYEQWLLTNEWKGGGVHPGDDSIAMYDSNESQTSNKIAKKPKKRAPIDIANDIYDERKSLFLERQKELKEKEK